MRNLTSYARLFLASWLFVGGLSILFGPSAASIDREARWRERQLRTIPVNQQDEWVRERDVEDARGQAYVRLFGILMGGAGFAASLREAVYIGARYGR
jgi:hypothetical protein